jgi:hypothetical protein
LKKITPGLVLAALFLFLLNCGQAIGQTSSSPTDPALLGKPASAIIECGRGYTTHELYDAKITVLAILRGEEAWKRLKEAAAGNQPPPADYEYVLAQIKFEYFARTTPGLCVHELKPEQFTSYSADGIDYPAASVTPPQPEMKGALRSGESKVGWVVLLVAKDDTKPLMSYSADRGAAIVHGGEKWFALY